MTSIRPFEMSDLFKFNNINLDNLTETFNMPFYLAYQSQWPESFVVAEGPGTTLGQQSHTTTTTSPGGGSATSTMSSIHSVPNASTGPSLMGYMLAKAEGAGNLWHSHVSAVTVCPTYRRLGLAKVLMDDLETYSSQVYNAYFCDLFVRSSNALAIYMYEKFGYVKYRRVLGYYSGEDAEDAWDMRKALKRDVNKKSVVPLDHPIYPEDLEW